MASDVAGVGLIGCGTIGSGVAKLLIEEAALYERRIGRKVELRCVLVKAGDEKNQTGEVPEDLITTDPETFWSAEIDIVVELAGGRGVISEFVRKALSMGKHVVTANKALVAAEGGELFALARENDAALAFEASCAGGIPFITALQFNLLSNRVEGMYGILNGTCNYILTQMLGAGKSYDTALAEAQAAGFAEADPTLDVSGGDTAHKLAILASLAFGVEVRDEAIPCQGIQSLNLEDVQFGAELGYEIKLLAIGEMTDAGLSLSVAPCFISREEQLAQVGGSFNAISLYGHAVGHTMYYGRGAGKMPTASAVVGDVLNIISGGYTAAFSHMQTWPDQQPAAKLVSPDDLESRYFLRINALDKPGTVSKFSTILGDESISIAAVLQHEVNVGGFVPVVIATHRAKAGAVKRALERVAALDEVEGEPVCIRIVDMPDG